MGRLVKLEDHRQEDLIRKGGERWNGIFKDAKTERLMELVG